MNKRQFINIVAKHPEPVVRILLATAVGVPDAVDYTVNALSCEELACPSRQHGPVRELIEALAAWNPSLLAQLVKTWRFPDSRSKTRAVQAWLASMRHLKALGAISRCDVPSFPLLFEEAEILWPEDAEAETSWRKVLQEVLEADPFTGFSIVRKRSNLPLVGPYPDVGDIQAAPGFMLRLLLGKCHLVANDVHELLFAKAESCLEGDLVQQGISVPAQEIGFIPTFSQMRPGDISGAEILFSLCRELSREFVDRLADMVAPKLQQLTDWHFGSGLESVYVLVGDWNPP